MRKRILILAIAVCLASSSAIFAADDQQRQPLDCSNPLKVAPMAVKNALGPLYQQDPPVEKLVEAHAALTSLVSDATNCRLNSQSSASSTDGDLVREWISLHDWINRLADFVYLKSIGRGRVDWELEYADFAQLYEFDT